MADVQIRAFLFFLACGLVILGMRAYASYSPRGRDAMRRLYSGGAIHFLRNGVAIGPVVAAGSIVIGLGALFPRSIAVWLLVVGMVLVGAAFLLSYRTPPPLMPDWLSDEIEAGRVAAARPSMIDWILFWIVVPFVLLGPIAAVGLILYSGSS